MLQDVDASFVTLLCHETSWHWCALLSRVEHIYLYMSLRGFICPFHHHHGGGGGALETYRTVVLILLGPWFRFWEALGGSLEGYAAGKSSANT